MLANDSIKWCSTWLNENFCMCMINKIYHAKLTISSRDSFQKKVKQKRRKNKTEEKMRSRSSVNDGGGWCFSRTNAMISSICCVSFLFIFSFGKCFIFRSNFRLMGFNCWEIQRWEFLWFLIKIVPRASGVSRLYFCIDFSSCFLCNECRFHFL